MRYSVEWGACACRYQKLNLLKKIKGRLENHILSLSFIYIEIKIIGINLIHKPAAVLEFN